MSNRNPVAQTAGRNTSHTPAILPPSHPYPEPYCVNANTPGRIVGLDEELNRAIASAQNIEDLVEGIDYALFGTPRTELGPCKSNEPACQPCIDTQVAIINNTNNRIRDRVEIIRNRLRRDS
jgi:hypothetical protein